MRHLMMLLLGSAVAAGLMTSCTTTPRADAGDALTRAVQAMGSLETLRYVAEGSGQTYGQPFEPNGPWPKVTLHTFTRTIDVPRGAMRDEVVMSRAEPRGGGGYPLEGRQRNDQFIVGNVAWNVVGGSVVPGARFATDRMHQLWITPHGVLEAARRRGAVVDAGGGFAFDEPGRFRARVSVDTRGLVTQVDSVVADAVLGDNPVVTTYADYRDAGGGVMFPTRIRQSAGGQTTLDLVVKDVQVNAPVAIDLPGVPEAARHTVERATAQKLADGVWIVGGGSHHSVLVEMIDHLVLIEAPLNDARMAAVFDEVRRVAAGKPVRFVIDSHAHFDHSGGLRYAAGEGATIVTHRGNAAYLESVLGQRATIAPDRLARSGRAVKVQGIDDRAVLSDGVRTIELHRVAGGPHSDTMLMAYLPRDRLLVEADAYTPLAQGAGPPATPNANHVNLIDNIERLGLDVERIVPLHGRVVPVGDLYAAARRTPRR